MLARFSSEHMIDYVDRYWSLKLVAGSAAAEVATIMLRTTNQKGLASLQTLDLLGAPDTMNMDTGTKPYHLPEATC